MISLVLSGMKVLILLSSPMHWLFKGTFTGKLMFVDIYGYISERLQMAVTTKQDELRFFAVQCK